jgi:hypothetical protein
MWPAPEKMVLVDFHVTEVKTESVAAHMASKAFESLIPSERQIAF